ncbi:MAG: hypothetical protein AB8C46_12970 [Burkholderiaceae bacterium]
MPDKDVDNAGVSSGRRESLASFVGGTYFALRMGLAALALTLPVVLYWVAKQLYGLPLQSSLSAYYYVAIEGQCATFPMRTLFLGYLFAMAAGLFFYKGLTPLENRLLNIAAVCIVLLAIFPERITTAEALTDPRIAQLFETCPAVMQWAEVQTGWVIHYAAGIGLFLMLAIVTWVCACKTLEFLPADKGNKTLFKVIYRTLSVLMLALPLAAYWLVQFFDNQSALYFVELAAIWTFAVYWLVRSWELALSGLEFRPDRS